jgi:hypothetical protein
LGAHIPQQFEMNVDDFHDDIEDNAAADVSNNYHN